MRNGILKRQATAAFPQAPTAAVNIDESSAESARASKYTASSSSEPNLPRAASEVDRDSVSSIAKNQTGDHPKQSFFEESACASSVPKDLNLVGEVNCSDHTWSVKFPAETNISIAAKNWDIGDLPKTGDDEPMIMSKKVRKARYEPPKQTDSSSSEGQFEMPSFKREGSYLEAMSNRVDLSDDEHSLCYKEKNTSRSAIMEFDKQILKAISETSIQSFTNSREQLDMLFSSTPIMAAQQRNVISTPNLLILKGDGDFNFPGYKEETDKRRSLMEVPRKSSIAARSTSTSEMSEADGKTKSFNGSTSSKGVHFCPFVSEVNWRDDSESTGRDSSYSLSSTPDVEVQNVQVDTF